MHSIFVHKFSTTTPEMTAIYEATLISAMKKYFSYGIETCCGIKKVRLLGTKADWAQLREKVAGLAKYKLDWWISKLLPVIDKFVAAANGQAGDQLHYSVG